jgi:hypothetical protein
MAEPTYENTIQLIERSADRQGLVFYLRYALPEVAAISPVSASLLSSAIAHLEDCNQPFEPAERVRKHS